MSSVVVNAGDVSEEEVSNLRKKAETIFCKTNYRFLREHLGLRPSKIHVLMGTTGSGKSSVMRSIIAEYLKYNPGTIYNWLSEEDANELYEGLLPYNLTREQMSKCLIESELTRRPGSVDEILERSELSGAQVLVIDNLTTSHFYMDKRVSDQSNLITKLKTWALKTQTAIIVVVHTRKDIVDNMGRLITENDIRGCASIVNMAHFFYVMQRFQIQGSFYQTLRIAKARGYVTNERMFLINYDREMKGYFGDKAIDFQSFKKMFNQRDKL